MTEYMDRALRKYYYICIHYLQRFSRYTGSFSFIIFFRSYYSYGGPRFRYCNALLTFFHNLLHKNRLPSDIYAFMFFCDFINFFILLFGFTAFSVSTSYIIYFVNELNINEIIFGFISMFFKIVQATRTRRRRWWRSILFI